MLFSYKNIVWQKGGISGDEDMSEVPKGIHGVRELLHKVRNSVGEAEKRLFRKQNIYVQAPRL